MGKYTNAQRQQAARRIVSDLEKIHGPAPEDFQGKLTGFLDDEDITSALAEIKRGKESKDWSDDVMTKYRDKFLAA